MVQVRDLALHAFRATFSLAGLVGAITGGNPVLVVVFTIAVFLGLFSLQHDLMHRALGLPRTIRAPFLCLIGSLLLMSGHATQKMHHLHHRCPLGPKDLEGRTAVLPLMDALLQSPWLVARMRWEAWRRSGRISRKWQLGEAAINLAGIVTLAFWGPMTQLVLLVSLGLQFSMPIWAGRIPHSAPRWVIEVAKKMAFTLSPTILSLAYHELHHQRPWIPTQSLGRFAPGVLEP